MARLYYETSKRGYDNLWRKAKIRPNRASAARNVARRLNANRTRYEKAVPPGLPWYWLAITHNLESGGNFSRHVHNGDPLTARTRRVPAGRPVTGSPPFTWEESARDALELKGLHKIAEWPVSRCLYEFERYNGFGYVARRINSPYVWSFTDLYNRGKYVADGRFSATAVSQQCGAAATLKALIDLKYVSLTKPVIEPDKKEVIGLDKPISPVVKSLKPVKHPEWDVVGWLIVFVKGLFK